MASGLDQTTAVPTTRPFAVEIATDAGFDSDWLAVAASAVGMVLCTGTLALYSFGVFVRPLTAEFGWSRTGLFGALSFFQFGLAFSSPIWGALVDRFGPRHVILVALVALSVLVASLGLLTPNLWHIYLVFAAIPLLGGGASPLGYAAIMVRRFDSRLGTALGLSLMGVGLGGAVLPPLAQFLLSDFGWRTAYVALGVLTFVITLPAAIVATRNVPGPVRRRAASALSIGAMLRTRAYILMAVAFVLLGTVSVGVLAHLVPMMVDHGFTPTRKPRASPGCPGWRWSSGAAASAGCWTACTRPTCLRSSSHSSPRPFRLLLGLRRGACGPAMSLPCCWDRPSGRRSISCPTSCAATSTKAAFGRLYGIAFGLYILGTALGPVSRSATSFDHLGGYRSGAAGVRCPGPDRRRRRPSPLPRYAASGRGHACARLAARLRRTRPAARPFGGAGPDRTWRRAMRIVALEEHCTFPDIAGRIQPRCDSWPAA